MALTASEKKKMERIEKELTEKKMILESIKEKASGSFSKYALKYNLWKLDEKTINDELKSLAKKHNMI